MGDIQQIVERLNAPPFEKGLTLVAFDEKAQDPFELLQMLSDVLAELDKTHKVEVRDEPPEVRGHRIYTALALLKYPFPPSVAEKEPFTLLLNKGDKATVYPIFNYVLSKFSQLKKRAYVARFLLPIDVPPEYLMHDEDGSLQDAVASYRQLQAEFKETHKGLDKQLQIASSNGPNGVPRNNSTPAELRREIAQLEEERQQLVEKIAGLKKKTTDIPGFAALLDATSSLRKGQEEEGRLQDRMQEQRAALQSAERKYADVNRRLAETRAVTKEDMSAEAVLDGVRREASESRDLARRVLPASIEARKETLGKLRAILAEPAKTDEELFRLRSEAAQLEDLVGRLTQESAAMQRAAGDDKLAMFRQQSSLVSRKLVEKEEALERARREADSLSREVESREAKLSELSGPRFMKRDEFKAYAAALRNKTVAFKQLKQELADIRQEAVVLARTEQLLKSRAGNLDEFLAKLEERRGVSGYKAVQNDLERVSNLKARIDETKGKTLNEISRVVQEINAAIQEKKAKLAPAVKELRALKTEAQETEAVYMREKAAYNTVAAGLESDKAGLEREADAVQEEMLAEESRIFQLQFTLEQTQSLLDRGRAEASFERNEGRYLRDFKTVKELYSQRLVQLEALAKELRRKQKDVKENAAAHALQRAKFIELRKILAAKLAVYRADPTGGLGGAALLGGEGGAGLDFEDMGGAHVMTLEQ